MFRNDERGSCNLDSFVLVSVAAMFVVVATVAAAQIAGILGVAVVAGVVVLAITGLRIADGVADRAYDRLMAVTRPYQPRPVGPGSGVGVRAGRCNWCGEPAALAIAQVDLGAPIHWAGICTLCFETVMVAPPGDAANAGPERLRKRLGGRIGEHIGAAMDLGDGNGDDCVWCGRPGAPRQLPYRSESAWLCDGCHRVVTETTDEEGLEPLIAADNLHDQLTEVLARIEATGGEMPAEACWLCHRRGWTVIGALRSPLPPRWGDQVVVCDPVLCHRHAHLCQTDTPPLAATEAGQPV